jgi:hypothetical protein
VSREEIVVDARFVVEALEKASGNKLDKVVITLQGLAEEHKVIAAASARLEIVTVGIRRAVIRAGFLAAVVTATLGDVDFAANDGFHVALVGFVKKVGGSEEVAMVGDGHGGHFLPRGFVKKLGGFAGTVEETVVCVEVQVNELGISHGS